MAEKSVALLLTVLTAIAYLSGYGFLYGYYQFFDVGIWELQLSIQDILVHALSAITATIARYYLVIAMIVFLTLLASVINTNRTQPVVSQISLTVTSIGLVLGLTLLLSVSLGREKASQEIKILNPFSLSGYLADGLNGAPYNPDNVRLLHLVTTNDTFFVVGVFETGRDRWVGRISRQDGSASFVYQDP